MRPPPLTPRRALVAVTALAAILAALLRPTDPATAVVPASEVRVLAIDGVISPVAARYLRRELRAAARDRARAVVLRLDTPGGLDTAMRDMTGEILGSPVPVVVWVGPSGARAASAGLFVTLASHVAAMAPGTSVGAAHPVQLGGGGDEAAIDKATADAAAFARSLAALRGRNADWVEQAVRQSVAASAEEAVSLGVVERLAPNVEALLAIVDGMIVTTSAGSVALDTDGAPAVERDMQVTETILQAITDPNIAYILFTIGVIGILGELYSPGAVFPGVTGVIALVMAFVGMGSLPVSAAGVALLLLGIGLLVGDLASEGLGLLAIPGFVAFALGSILLYQPLSATPATPAVRVEPWLIVATVGVLVGFFAIVLRALVRSARAPVAIGSEALVGRDGVALTELAPSGTVRVDSEVWSAVADDGPIAAGERVEIVAPGVTLRVRRKEER